MNELKELEQSLFGHLKTDIIPITKRRKMLRRLERKKERLLAQEKQIDIGSLPSTSNVDRPGSLWDVKEMPPRVIPHTITSRDQAEDRVMGPKQPTMYTVKENKIVRLEPVEEQPQEFRAVDIVMPVNDAEVQLLEGTKMCLDDIKKIDRFKDYEPGIPSKVSCSIIFINYISFNYLKFLYFTTYYIIECGRGSVTFCFPIKLYCTAKRLNHVL